MSRDILQNVQVLRLVAATSIVVYHTRENLLPASSPLFTIDFGTGVDIFFLLSGFIMAHITRGAFGSRRTVGPFLVRRAIRIVPPYWFFTALMLIAAVLFGNQIQAIILNPEVIVTSFAFIPWQRSDGEFWPVLLQGWTLVYEAFFYLAFALALVFQRGLAMLCAGFVLIVIAGLWIPDETFLVGYWTKPIILEFVVGIILAKAYERGWRLPLWGGLACGALGVAFLTLPKMLDIGDFDRLAHRGVPALLLVIAFVFCRRGETVGSVGRVLRIGGDASYVLYLSHAFVIGAIGVLARSMGWAPSWPLWIAGMSLAIAGAVIFHLIVEKPVLDWLTRRAIKKPASDPMDANKTPRA